MRYKAVLTLKSVDKNLVCDHSNESYFAVLSCGALYMRYKAVLILKTVDKTLVNDYSN